MGGSTIIDQTKINAVIKKIKKLSKLPIILFPGNITGISRDADAILFSSLLNSENPYFIIEAQALGAPTVKEYGLEAIPTGYLIIGDGGTAGFIGNVKGIPHNKPKLAAMYALASQYLGMRVIYLEAGSGVISHTPSQIVSAVRKVFDGIVMVGGGITNASQAMDLAMAGADILVVGTLLENPEFEKPLKQIIKKVQNINKT